MIISALYSLSALIGHGLLYMVLITLAMTREPPKGKEMRAYANLMAALTGLTAVVWTVYDLNTMFASHAYRGSFAFPVLPLLLVIPVLATSLAERARRRDGRLHAVAARPEWTAALLVGALPVVVGEASFMSWLLLAPVLMLPLALFESAAPGREPIAVHALEIRPPAPRPAPPIEIQVEKVVRAEGTCAVCAEAVTSRAATCMRCDAQQHVECFEFLGQCGIYGCGSQRFRA